MEIFWCRLDPWRTDPAAALRFCARAGIPTGDFIRVEDLIPHAAGRYLLGEGFRRYCPGAPLPELRTAPGGKPYFLGGQPCFSISHGGDIALCAFSREAVGADVEAVSAFDPSLLPAFHPREQAYLRTLPAGSGAPVLCELWTRKESLLKARGGVLADLTDQESLLTPEGGWLDRVSGFFLRAVPLPDPAYRAAVNGREDGPLLLTGLELPSVPDGPPR